MGSEAAGQERLPWHGPLKSSRLIAWFEYDSVILQNPCPLHRRLSGEPCRFGKILSAGKLSGWPENLAPLAGRGLLRHAGM